MYGKNNQISIVGYQKTKKKKIMVGPTKKETLITLIVHAYLDQVLYKDFVWNILFTALHWLMFRSVICFHYYYATLWPLLSHSFPHITVNPKRIFIIYIQEINNWVGPFWWTVQCKSILKNYLKLDQWRTLPI